MSERSTSELRPAPHCYNDLECFLFILVHSVKQRIHLAGAPDVLAPATVEESHDATLRIIEALPEDGMGHFGCL